MKNNNKQSNKKFNQVKKNQGSSSEDEVEIKEKKIGKKDASKNSFQGKKRQNKENKAEKKEKLSELENKYTQIAINAYECKSREQVPHDAHIVVIDTFGLVCQLYERAKIKTALVRNFSEAKEELFAVCSAAMAVIENIILGVRYSDLPSEIVDMFPRTRVVVRKDYLEMVHACSIPKGKIYIERGNKSVGCLIRFIQAAWPANIQQNQLPEHLDGICNIINQEKINPAMIYPSDEGDASLTAILDKHAGAKLNAREILVQMRNYLLSLNATVADNLNYSLYVPVLCEQSEICYLSSNNGDVSLVTFMPITNNDILKRMQIYAYGIRFFIAFVKVYKETKQLVDMEKVENETCDTGLIPIFEKYGMMQFTRHMVFEDEDDKSIVVEENISVPKDIKQPEKVENTALVWTNSKLRTSLVENGLCIKLSALPVGDGVYTISTDGIIGLKTAVGKISYTALVSETNTHQSVINPWVERIVHDEKRIWSNPFKLIDEEAKQLWIPSLPALPQGW